MAMIDTSQSHTVQKSPPDHERADNGSQDVAEPSRDLLASESPRQSTAVPHEADLDPREREAAIPPSGRVAIWAAVVIAFVTFLSLGVVTARIVTYDLTEDPGRYNAIPDYSNLSVPRIWAAMIEHAPAIPNLFGGQALLVGALLVTVIAAGFLLWLAVVPDDAEWLDESQSHRARR